MKTLTMGDPRRRPAPEMEGRLEALECAVLELAQRAGAWVAPDSPEVRVRREAQLRSPNVVAVADRAYRRLCERFGAVEPFEFDGTNVEQLRERAARPTEVGR